MRKNMHTKGQTFSLGLLLIILVVGGAVYFIAKGSGNGAGLSVEQQEQAKKVDLASCSGISSVTYTLVDRDTENLGTTPGVDARVYMAGKQKIDKRIASGGTQSFTPKVEHRALVGNGSTTYYAKDVSFSTGCSNQDIITDLDNEGTLTLTVKNSDDSQPNSVSDRTPLGQNEDDNEIVVKYDISSNDFWGNRQAPGASLVSCRYDTADITSIKVDGASTGTTPQWQELSANDEDGSGADAYDTESTYRVANLEDGAFKEITLLVDTVSGSDPGNGNFTCNFYASNLDLNEEDLSLIKGVEDEDFNLITPTGASSNVTVHYS